MDRYLCLCLSLYTCTNIITCSYMCIYEAIYISSYLASYLSVHIQTHIYIYIYISCAMASVPLGGECMMQSNV